MTPLTGIIIFASIMLFFALFGFWVIKQKTDDES